MTLACQKGAMVNCGELFTCTCANLSLMACSVPQGACYCNGRRQPHMPHPPPVKEKRARIRGTRHFPRLRTFSNVQKPHPKGSAFALLLVTVP